MLCAGHKPRFPWLKPGGVSLAGVTRCSVQRWRVQRKWRVLSYPPSGWRNRHNRLGDFDLTCPFRNLGSLRLEKRIVPPVVPRFYSSLNRREALLGQLSGTVARRVPDRPFRDFRMNNATVPSDAALTAAELRGACLPRPHRPWRHRQHQPVFRERWPGDLVGGSRDCFRSRPVKRSPGSPAPCPANRDQSPFQRRGPPPRPSPRFPISTPARPPSMRRLPSNNVYGNTMGGYGSLGESDDGTDEHSQSEIRRVRMEDKELRKLLQEMKRLLQEAGDSEQQWVTKQSPPRSSWLPRTNRSRN